MKKLIIIILFLFINTTSYSSSLDEKQCEQLGGTFSDLGCLFPTEDQKEFVKDPNLYTPSKEKCECMGGKWHEEYGCIASISEEECKKFGGVLDPELGCKKTLTKDQCEKIGGSFLEDGTCDTKMNKVNTK